MVPRSYYKADPTPRTRYLLDVHDDHSIFIKKISKYFKLTKYLHVFVLLFHVRKYDLNNVKISKPRRSKMLATNPAAGDG